MPSTLIPPIGTTAAALAAERREKKRKHDRDAQRLARERTKTRVKELEDLVQALQAANEHPERVNELLAQVQSAREENVKLHKRLRKAAEILQLNVNPDSDKNEHLLSEHVQPDEGHFRTLTSEINELCFDNSALRTSDDTSAFGTPKDSSIFNTQLNELSPDHQSYYYPVGEYGINNLLPNVQATAVGGQLVPPKCSGNENLTDNDPVTDIAATILKTPGLEGRFWLLAGNILNHILNMAEEMMTPRALDDDIVIRSCTEGWDIVRRRYWLDSGWRWLQQLDKHMYSHLSIPNRMAIMRMMRMQYLIQRHPSRASKLELPEFMAARPAQERIVHEKLVEHFVWPGMREHALFSRDRYATNRFMENFRNHLRFAWPHDPHETYELHPESELYTFTSLFVYHQSRIECWQMEPEFFNLFPELRVDIPAAVHSLSDPLTGRIGFEYTDLASGEDQDKVGSNNLPFEHTELIPPPSVASVS